MQKLLDSTFVTLFWSKYVAANDETGEHVPVSFLLAPWDLDAHYVAYTHAANTRLRKGSDNTGTTFKIITVDLDAHDTVTTEQDWWHLVYSAQLLDCPPNIVTRTKSGAHLIWFITPVHDPMLYEGLRLNLIDKVRPLENAHPWTVDETRDWTRFFRAPRVVREDDGVETDLRESLIWGLNGKVLNLATWKPKDSHKAKPKIVTLPLTPNLTGAARYAAAVPGAVAGEGGHRHTFGLACRLVTKFGLDEDQLLSVLDAWNGTCDPPWSDYELRHKASEAIRAVIGVER